MAKKIPARFLESGEGSISSYDYTDIANGLGYNNFYPGGTVDSVGTDYMLFPITIESAAKECAAAGTLTEFNFDTSAFNLQRVVKGTAFLSMNFIQNSTAAGSDVDVNLYKVDAAGTTETAISSLVEFSGAASTANQYFLLDLPLTQTMIKKGEKLRLSIAVKPLNPVVTSYFGSDPTDAASANMAAGTTLTKLAVPFRIDL